MPPIPRITLTEWEKARERIRRYESAIPFEQVLARVEQAIAVQWRDKTAPKLLRGTSPRYIPDYTSVCDRGWFGMSYSDCREWVSVSNNLWDLANKIRLKIRQGTPDEIIEYRRVIVETSYESCLNDTIDTYKQWIQTITPKTGNAQWILDVIAYADKQAGGYTIPNGFESKVRWNVSGLVGSYVSRAPWRDLEDGGEWTAGSSEGYWGADLVVMRVSLAKFRPTIAADLRKEVARRLCSVVPSAPPVETTDDLSEEGM